MSSEQITKRVLSESLKNLMREKTLDRITTDEICSEAGTSRRNFYRHFTDILFRNVHSDAACNSVRSEDLFRTELPNDEN